VDLYVGTPVDELKGHCAGYAVKEKKKKKKKLHMQRSRNFDG